MPTREIERVCEQIERLAHMIGAAESLAAAALLTGATVENGCFMFECQLATCKLTLNLGGSKASALARAAKLKKQYAKEHRARRSPSIDTGRRFSQATADELPDDELVEYLRLFGRVPVFVIRDPKPPVVLRGASAEKDGFCFGWVLEKGVRRYSATHVPSGSGCAFSGSLKDTKRLFNEIPAERITAAVKKRDCGWQAATRKARTTT